MEKHLLTVCSNCNSFSPDNIETLYPLLSHSLHMAPLNLEFFLKLKAPIKEHPNDFLLSYTRRGVWVSFTSSSHWRKIKSVQTICIETINGMSSFVKNSVLLKSALNVQNSIKSQPKLIFYKNSSSSNQLVRLLGRGIFSHKTKHKIKPNPLTKSSLNFENQI